AMYRGIDTRVRSTWANGILSPEISTPRQTPSPSLPPFRRPAVVRLEHPSRSGLYARRTRRASVGRVGGEGRTPGTGLPGCSKQVILIPRARVLATLVTRMPRRRGPPRADIRLGRHPFPMGRGGSPALSYNSEP